MKPNQRRCVSCQKVGDKLEFLRVVRCDGAVIVGSGMGRSAYICPNLKCLQLAQKKNRLGRSLKTAVSAEIYEILKSRITETTPSQNCF